MKSAVIILTLTCACFCLQAQVSIITTIAGIDSAGFCCDGGPATNAKLYLPESLCFDKNGSNIYIADAGNNRIRKMNLYNGIINTIAGTGIGGFNGDGNQATNTELWLPDAVFTDTTGNIYSTDPLNYRIRKVTIATGIITTIAGNGNPGYTGDGLPATEATINEPSGLCLDKFGNIYIADYSNNVVRKVSASTGIITTLAGTGTTGYSGDGGPATNARLFGPDQVFADSAGNIFICDQWNSAVRKVNATTGIITTIAGTGIAGYSGDGGAATNAELNQPAGVFVEKNENIFIAEYGNGTIREIDGVTGIITTVAGCGIPGFSGDGGPAVDAELIPGDVFIDSFGTMYIADYGNNRIREVYNPKLGTPIIKSQASIQQYNLQPNPNDGQITLRQLMPDSQPVQAKIWNASGMAIYKEELLFMGGIDQLHIINAVPGLYLLQLTDSNGKVFTLKFVIQ
jgi:hypothetical protein